MLTFSVESCVLCGQMISINGLSTTSHMKMHIREGYYTLIKWNPNEYARTEKAFNKEEYQKAHPNKPYNRSDYFPYTCHPVDLRLRRKLTSEMIKRKGNETN